MNAIWGLEGYISGLATNRQVDGAHVHVKRNIDEVGRRRTGSPLAMSPSGRVQRGPHLSRAYRQVRREASTRRSFSKPPQAACGNRLLCPTETVGIWAFGPFRAEQGRITDSASIHRNAPIGPSRHIVRREKTWFLLT